MQIVVGMSIGGLIIVVVVAVTAFTCCLGLRKSVGVMVTERRRLMIGKVVFNGILKLLLDLVVIHFRKPHGDSSRSTGMPLGRVGI